MIIAAAAISLLAQGWVQPVDASPFLKVQGYPRGLSREEMEWRRRHPEIPGYAPYTPGYGPYIENDRPRWQGTPNPYWREEYAPVDYCRVLCSWGTCRTYCR